MSVLDMAREDMKKITSDGDGFAVEIVLTAPDDSTVTIKGIHSKHHMSVSPESGALINSKAAHAAFAESLLADYPVRNTGGEVDMNGHRLDVKDSSGSVKYYYIRECFADETLGLLTCLLEDRVNA